MPITYVRDWHQHAKFIEANAAHVRTALTRLPADAQTNARLVFTAHSIPVSMAGADRYAQQVTESARLVAAVPSPVPARMRLRRRSKTRPRQRIVEPSGSP